MPAQTSRVAITVRNPTLDDISGIIAVVAKVYPEMGAYTPGMVQGQISAFPTGQFVIEYEGEIVGYAASFRIKEKVALKPHTWREITGGGYYRCQTL